VTKTDQRAAPDEEPTQLFPRTRSHTRLRAGDPEAEAAAEGGDLFGERPLDVRATMTAPVSVPGRASQGWLRGRSGVLAAGAGLSLVLAVALVTRATERPLVPEARRGVAAAVLLASLHAIGAAEGHPQTPGAPNAESQASPGLPASGVPASPARRVHAGGDPRARSACDPPYFIDGTGIRRVKRECL
jgi:serine/threonine-protein kinase